MGLSRAEKTEVKDLVRTELRKARLADLAAQLDAVQETTTGVAQRAAVLASAPQPTALRPGETFVRGSVDVYVEQTDEEIAHARVRRAAFAERTALDAQIAAFDAVCAEERPDPGQRDADATWLGAIRRKFGTT